MAKSMSVLSPVEKLVLFYSIYIWKKSHSDSNNLVSNQLNSYTCQKLDRCQFFSNISLISNKLRWFPNWQFWLNTSEALIFCTLNSIWYCTSSKFVLHGKNECCECFPAECWSLSNHPNRSLSKVTVF